MCRPMAAGTCPHPLYRDDVESFPDLAEEVIREYGYDHIVPTFLNTASVTNGGLNYDQKQQLKTKASAGCTGLLRGLHAGLLLQRRAGYAAYPRRGRSP